jgi:uncharacterized membrane protein
MSDLSARQRLDTPRTSRRRFALTVDAETVGQFSESIARFLGTGRFLLWQTILVAVWISLNLFAVTLRWDPYPFILLNLFLSMLAAIQAPIIMMSQKRQETKDRLRSMNDYQVNLKAELEIRHLHEKLDHLITKQWQRLAEIQQIQLDLLDEGKRRG